MSQELTITCDRCGEPADPPTELVAKGIGRTAIYADLCCCCATDLRTWLNESPGKWSRALTANGWENQ